VDSLDADIDKQHPRPEVGVLISRLGFDIALRLDLGRLDRQILASSQPELGQV
jgi:hypothetical protein